MIFHDHPQNYTNESESYSFFKNGILITEGDKIQYAGD